MNRKLSRSEQETVPKSTRICLERGFVSMKNLLDSCRWVLLGMSVLSLSLSAQTPPKTKHRALARPGYYNIASGTYAGEMLRGAATVEAYNLNTIRYHYA